MRLLTWWRALPGGVRRGVGLSWKALATGAAFYLLLNHRLELNGERVSLWQAAVRDLAAIEPVRLVPYLLLAAAIKFVGIFAAMLRWHLLLIGQRIRFDLRHVVGSFLIGRFLGTFLPSTVGLDAYKLYDAARFSGCTVEPAAATVVEKVMGISGIFLCFLVALPLGASVLGPAAPLVALVTVPLAFGVIGALFLFVLRPSAVAMFVRLLPTFARRRVGAFVERVSVAMAAYRERRRLLVAVLGLSFAVHFCTAVLYFFTALAVGATTARFFEVTLASTIQIFATVMSPLTIAGEGVREIVQALLLAKRIGASQSVLSAALGFWAAEALTLTGAVFWWLRREGYRPRVIELGPAAPALVSPSA